MSQRIRRPQRNIRPPGLTADVEALGRVAIEDRWGLGLMAIAWVHLATFFGCYVMYTAGDLRPPRYLMAWAVELIVVVVLLRRMVTNNGRRASPPLIGLLARIWITFLILAFSVASLNQLTGMPPEWFKPVWCTLSTFGFAMMGWIVSLRFLVPAVQMSLTGMLMAKFPMQAYLIYAISWWVALHLVALTLEKERSLLRNAMFEPSLDLELTQRLNLETVNGRAELSDTAPMMASRS